MAMKQFNIPISMLRQYCFCPRIPYFYLVRQIRTNEQPWVRIGKLEHNRQEMLLKRRNLSRFGITPELEWTIHNNVELYSEHINLHGVSDAVVKTPNGDFLLEFKNSEHIKSNLGAKIQLAAYSMIYEEKYNTEIKYGFILYGTKAKTFVLQINNEIKDKVIEIRDHIFSFTDYGILPSTSATENKCSQCEFFNYCSDRY